MTYTGPPLPRPGPLRHRNRNEHLASERTATAAELLKESAKHARARATTRARRPALALALDLPGEPCPACGTGRMLDPDGRGPRCFVADPAAAELAMQAGCGFTETNQRLVSAQRG